MSDIFDLADNPLSNSSYTYTQERGTVRNRQIKIRCRTGRRFYATAVEHITVEAKEESETEYTNLESSFIDLTPYAGQVKIFDLRFTTADIPGDVVQAYDLVVSL